MSGAVIHSKADSEPTSEPFTQTKQPRISSRDKKKSANRARHRLLSIQYDVQRYLEPLISRQAKLIVANERCGTCLKRLNLPLLKTASCQDKLWILDSSNKKEMPDSFSRTLPIWACVLNRISEVFRRDLGQPPLFSDEDLQLHLPTWIVPEPEQHEMESVIDTRVQELYQSQAIVDIPGFMDCMTKPLRPFWITPLHSQQLPTEEELQSCHSIVCCNASNIRLDANNINSRIVWREEGQFWYTPGAADDHESWARNLTPQVFWSKAAQFDPSRTDAETDDWIDGVAKAANSQKEFTTGEEQSFDWVGELNMAIGTRRAGRPPHCWKYFDAILNVTNTEYDELLPLDDQDKFYLQLPVEEGKRDKQELERWMAVGVVFCAKHARQKRRILIHCAQGRDRSVAVGMAVVQLFCHPRYPLQWNWPVLDSSIEELLSLSSAEESNNAQTGLPRSLAPLLLDREGRDQLLRIVRGRLQKPDGAPLASKESLRVVLHLIRQDREKAEPTRSTLQKLNRFFMSDAYKKPPN